MASRPATRGSRAGGSRSPLRGARAQVNIALRKDDYVAAFKTLPLRKEDLDLAVCTWRAAAERGWGLQMFALPFGGALAATIGGDL